MKRDYAKRYYKKTKSNKPKIGFIVIVLFLLLGVGVGIYLKLYPQIFLEKPEVSAFFTRFKSVFNKQQPGTIDSAKKQKTAEEPSVHFSFYSALPNMRVAVTSASTAASVDAPLVPAKSGYILQFGVFKEYSQASDLRLSLLLSGIETEIEEVGKDQDVVYRIQQGPFSTMTQAKSFQQKWQKKGMEASIKKI